MRRWIFKARFLGIAVGAALVALLPAAALAATAPGLGSAASFAVLSAAPGGGGAVTCTTSTITGDVGSSGLPASVVQTGCTISGAIVAPVSSAVLADFNTAYDAYAPISCDQTLTGTLAGVTLPPGVYCFDAAATLTGLLTLDGPATATWIAGFLVGVPAGFLDIGTLSDLSNIGTLFAFVLVSVGVIILRYRDPGRRRGFRAPGGLAAPVLSVVFCVLLMSGLPILTWLRFFAWLIIGLTIYYLYSRHHSEFAGKS